MKTSVPMLREMGEFKVYQRTSDGFFNATDLVNKWNLIPENPKRDLSRFWESKKVKEFLKALAIEEGYNTPNRGYLKTRGKNGGTWVNPYIFIKLAMWINPKFEVQVIKFVYDQLIEFRNDAGDNYKALASSLRRLKNSNYGQVAIALNYIVFGRHEKGLRQIGTEKQMNELRTLEEKLAFAINMGYIKSYDSLMVELRKIWSLKYNPIKKLTKQQ